MEYVEIESASELVGRSSLDACVLQGLDLTAAGIDWSRVEVTPRTFLLGCRLSHGDEMALRLRGAVLFPRFSELPYDPYRGRLYTSADLMQGYDGRDFERTAADQATYRNFLATRESHSIVDELAQRIHDHSLNDALDDLLRDCGKAFPRGIVGIMGGHQSPRGSQAFREVAQLSHRLSRLGFLVLTGGGPGAMEAGNLGALLAPHDEPALDEAIGMLRSQSSAGPPVPAGYLRSAQDVIQRFAPAVAAEWGFRAPGAASFAGASLSIPTWTYGHEPSNLFASHIAKLFQNSVREEGLVTIANAGLVFAKGRAGTCQEAFTDAVQNYYAQDPDAMQPMAFFPRAYWTETVPVVPCPHKLARAGGRPFAQRVAAFDRVDEIVDFLQAPPPIV